MWIYGGPVQQTIFSLIYFTDAEINNPNRKDNSIFRMYIDSTLHSFDVAAS